MGPLVSFDLSDELRPLLLGERFGRKEIQEAADRIEAAGYPKTKINQILGILMASHLEIRTHREKAFREGVEWYAKQCNGRAGGQIFVQQSNDLRSAASVIKTEISGGQQGAVGSSPHAHNFDLNQGK